MLVLPLVTSAQLQKCALAASQAITYQPLATAMSASVTAKTATTLMFVVSAQMGFISTVFNSLT